ncbi:MAG: endonuclease III domain-containing protein [Peptococcaceae bacterium]|jgi:endonuclease-3 related protein|nr:endonuclease III domain-containing protein [Peptococcaceae bacterium]MDH7525361.1 endonuclease III domain-containing protein [Peptococcaceae bacterium]
MSCEQTELTGKLMDIYNRLFEKFGPRRWWPADNNLEMVLGAILVQNVSWKNTAAALQNLREKGLIDLKKLLQVPVEELEELIRPTRYYRTKAKKVKAFACLVGEKYEGDLERLLGLPLTSLREELIKVYGIGEETADSIVLYGSRQPIFVVDAYTRRIFHRLGFFSENIGYGEMQTFFMRHLKADVQLYNEYHALLDCLGSRLCRAKNPGCGECPLDDLCKYEEKGEGK